MSSFSIEKEIDSIAHQINTMKDLYHVLSFDIGIDNGISLADDLYVELVHFYEESKEIKRMLLHSLSTGGLEKPTMSRHERFESKKCVAAVIMDIEKLIASEANALEGDY